MPGINHNADDKSRSHSFKAFREEVDTVSATVGEIAEHLPEALSAEAFLHLTRSFESISKQFANMVLIQSHPFYVLLTGSRQRLAYTKLVVKEAGKVAQLFEKYAKKPRSYSAVNSRIQLNQLQAGLENLKSVIPPRENLE